MAASSSKPTSATTSISVDLPPGLGYKTRVITYGVAPSLHVEFKHSHVKQYFKEQRALRTETTINDPLDFQRTKGLETLPHSRAIGRQFAQRYRRALDVRCYPNVGVLRGGGGCGAAHHLWADWNSLGRGALEFARRHATRIDVARGVR